MKFTQINPMNPFIIHQAPGNVPYSPWIFLSSNWPTSPASTLHSCPFSCDRKPDKPGRYRESYGSSQAGTMVPKIQYSYVPICSMVLVYLPTKLGHLWGTCWLLFSSTMNHLGYSLRLWMFIPEDVVFSMVLIHPHCGVPRILSMVETRNSAKMGRPYRTKPVTYWMIYWLLPTKIRYYGR